MTTTAGLAGGDSGLDSLRPMIATALDALGKGVVDRDGPLPRGGPDAMVQAMRDTEAGGLPEEGAGAQRALTEIAHAFTAGAADPAHPACAAHLHTPPLAVAVAADLVASVMNSSLDSWDQAPSGTIVESEVLRTLSALAGFDPDVASGSITSGGTESNLTGLLLAREHALRTDSALPAEAGIPGQSRARIFCSEAAHFSVARSAGVLGLGEHSVTHVPSDARHRMNPEALRELLAQAHQEGDVPVAVVATAGTTDLGVIDPLPEIAEIARAAGVWLHVDAAYGGGALFSRRLAPLLTGLGLADSVALDLHKLGWQPVAAGVFLARHKDLFEPLDRTVAYLNPDDDEQQGFHSLLGRSLRTTRRPDALKIAVTLRALGRSGMEALVNRCHDLALYAAASVTAHPRLELCQDPVLSTVVFRYLPSSGDPDLINAALRRSLMTDGRAVVGRTEIGEAVFLKLTLLNPHATESDVDTVLADVVAAGDKEAQR